MAVENLRLKRGTWLKRLSAWKLRLRRA
jgi:hypothetical protein